MELSREQRDRVTKLVYEGYTEEFPEAEWKSCRAKLMSSIEHPMELHLYATNYNWDGGFEELKEVLDHPKCDKATALLIYAMGSPGFFYRKLEKNAALRPYEQDVWDFLREIEQRIRNEEFQSGRVAFDPRKHVGTDLYRVNNANLGNRLVPDIMKNATTGESVRNTSI